MPKVVDWKQIGPFLASGLLATTEVDPASYDVWLLHLRPIHSEMVPELTKIFRNANRSTFQRNLSASVLCTFVDDGDLLLAELGVDATPEQLTRSPCPSCNRKSRQRRRGFARFWSRKSHSGRDRGRARPRRQRQAHAAALLFELEDPVLIDRAPAWEMLKYKPDPRVASYLIARLADCRANPELLLSRLQREENSSVRAGLILALGSYPVDSIPEPARTRIREHFLQVWQADPNCSVHSAAEWALRSFMKTNRICRNTKRAVQSRDPRRPWVVHHAGRFYLRGDQRAHRPLSLARPRVKENAMGMKARSRGTSSEHLQSPRPKSPWRNFCVINGIFHSLASLSREGLSD